MYVVYLVTFVDTDWVELLPYVVSCMKKSSLKTLRLSGMKGWMKGVPQCCEVFDCLRSSEIEEFEFELHSTSLSVSVMMIYRILSSPLHSPQSPLWPIHT